MKKVIVILVVIVVAGFIASLITGIGISEVIKKVTTMKFFDLSEFDSPAIATIDTNDELYEKNGKPYIKGSGLKNMKVSHLSMLDKAREQVEKEWNKNYPDKKIVFSINSGFRTQHYNDSLKDSVKTSAHVSGLASDISLAGYTDEQIKVVLKALVDAGFKRFGLGKTYVHVDNDPDKPTPAVWDYGYGSIDINPFDLVKN